LPVLRCRYVLGDEQRLYLRPSSRHLKLAPVSSAVKRNLATRDFDFPRGPFSIRVSGGSTSAAVWAPLAGGGTS
jgi:hypothetical protein